MEFYDAKKDAIKKKLTMTPEEAQRQADKDLLWRMMNPPPGITAEDIIKHNEEHLKELLERVCLTQQAEEILKYHREFFERLGGRFEYGFSERGWEAEVRVFFDHPFELDNPRELLRFKKITTQDGYEMTIVSFTNRKEFKLYYYIPNAYHEKKEARS